MAYKNKLGDVSHHIMNQIDDLRIKVRQNVNALNKQIDHSIKNPPVMPFRPWHDPRFEDFRRDQIREERTKRAREKKEKKLLKRQQAKTKS